MGSTESAVLHRPEPDLTGPERLARRAELEAELRGLGAQITATQARFVAVLADYDALEGWGEWGARSALDWLSNHCGHAGPLGRAELALAHALPHLPLIRGAMEAGALSLDKAKAIASVAVPDTEEELLSLASHATANQIQKAMAAARRALNSKHAERMRRERYLDTSWDAYGYLQVRGQLSPAEGALFRKALAAAKESLYREQRSEGSTDEVPPEGHDDPRPEPTADAHAPPAAARADALVAMAESFMDHGPVAQGDSGENYQVIIRAPASVLDGG